MALSGTRRTLIRLSDGTVKLSDGAMRLSGYARRLSDALSGS
jgi:hypothetical protein